MKTAMVIFALVLASCASKPNYQLNCEAQGGPLFKCETCPWYVGNCSRLK